MPSRPRFRQQGELLLRFHRVGAAHDFREARFVGTARGCLLGGDGLCAHAALRGRRALIRGVERSAGP